MSSRFLITGALGGFLMAGAAHATVLINSINVANPTDGHDGASDNTQLMGQSFYAPSTPALGAAATLLLSSAHPNDGGSIMVYLVADDGSGAGAGIAGSATYAPQPGGTSFTGLTNDVQVGSIADSSLTTNPTLATVNISSAAFSTVSAETSHGNTGSSPISAATRMNGITTTAIRLAMALPTRPTGTTLMAHMVPALRSAPVTDLTT